MVIDFEVGRKLSKASSASSNVSPHQTMNAGAAGHLATKFLGEQRDLYAIICNNLARLQDELDADDPRQLLVSSTLRLAHASAALTPEWQRPSAGMKRAQFEASGLGGCVDTTRTTQGFPQEIQRISADSQVQLSAFTPRQLTVMPLLAKGLSTKDIARRLGLCPGTVKVHLGGIYRIMKSRSRLEAVIKAKELLGRELPR